jgi:hypothetical protein
MLKNPQVIYLWKAPLRPYKKRSKLILRFYVALSLLLSLIIFFFGDKILLLPIWSILFLFYTLTITPPPEVENKITTFGIESAGVIASWENLSYFYFGRRFGFDTLTIVSQPPFFYHFYLVLPNNEVKEKVFSILTQHLIYQEKPKKTLTDKIADFFLSLLPEEEEETITPKDAPVASESLRPA